MLPFSVNKILNFGTLSYILISVNKKLTEKSYKVYIEEFYKNISGDNKDSINTFETEIECVIGRESTKLYIRQKRKGLYKYFSDIENVMPVVTNK